MQSSQFELQREPLSPTTTPRNPKNKRVQQLHGHYTPNVAGTLYFTFDNTFSWLTDKSIQIKVIPQGAPPPRDLGVHMSYVCRPNSTWAEAQSNLSLTVPAAVARSIGRLLFWHVLQPAAYLAALWTVWYQLDALQTLLGLIVGVRELIYLLATFALAVKNPTFLLLDVVACYRDRDANRECIDTNGSKIMNGGLSFGLMYMCMPEKAVERALFSEAGVGAGVGARRPLCVGAGAVFDIIGCAALGYGLSTGKLPMVLAIGYCMTALGGLGMLYEIVNSTGRDDEYPRGGARLLASFGLLGLTCEENFHCLGSSLCCLAGAGMGMGGVGGGPGYGGGGSPGYGGGGGGRGGQLGRMDSTVSPPGSPGKYTSIPTTT